MLLEILEGDWVLKWSMTSQLKWKRHAEEVQSEQENKKIDEHMALPCKQGLCNQIAQQTAS